MGQVLGIGVSHYPPLSGNDSDMANILKGRINDPDIPASVKDPATWPELMRKEWGSDSGASGAAQHRAAMVGGLRRARKALEEFNPDFVLIWGDDQYENFKEDIVPAFSVQAYEDLVVYPWKHATESAMFNSNKKDEWGGGKPNVWGESAETHRVVKGHRQGAKFVASELLKSEFDIAYSYKPLHHPSLAHAFLNAILYIDYDREGFPWPVVPMAINCYGSNVISYRGFISRWADRGREQDPPSPSPKRCFDLGAAVGRILRASPYRVAVVASSSWSHAFLVDKTYRMQPDAASDRELYQAMVDGNYSAWREWGLEKLVDAGQQEVLNWFCLLGAMNEIGAKLKWSEFVESYVFNSNKVAAIFEAK